ncbi:hypothetical protein [Granulicatella elegans]|uniref:hypothetical protein n=1 Tax=Granulicatella elegans TaxID=137732 RepID=UPI001D1366DE|nr:hypothetical protein [Granulicatella elegans]UEA32122.1 hypothetical protein LK443_04110 [Granulicatella elegans]
MSIVTQINLFSEEENLGELEKSPQILSVLPTEKLLKKLDEERENDRNDYPVVCMWRLLLTKNIFQHATEEEISTPSNPASIAILVAQR